MDESVNANPTIKFDFLNKLDLDQDVVRRLSILLQGVIKGSEDIYVTPITRNASPSILLNEWDAIFQSKISLINEPLKDLELSNRSKFSPRSIAIPWKERISSIKDYFNVDENIPDIGPLADVERGNFLRPISLTNAVKILKNDTNSGLPYYKRKSLIKEIAERDFHKLAETHYPCVLFTRTQEDRKTRNVWGYPIYDTINEMMYYKPYLDYERRLAWRACLNGPKQTDIAVTKIIDNCTSTKMKLISIDFSAFDASISPKLQLAAFNSISNLFQKKYADEFHKIYENFSTIGIITPDGVFSGKHGIPSGSVWTNAVGSRVQKIISEISGVTKDEFIQIQGDDGIYCIPPESVETFLNTFMKYGLNVNKSKSYVRDNYVIYLQNLFHPDYRKEDGIIGGVYPTYRALNRIIYQERWSNFEDYGIAGKDYYAIRSLSILENCKHHPLFEDLVKLILKHDKYKLSPSQKGIKDYVKMINESEGSAGILVNQYGDDIKGIKSFESYKLVNKLLS